MERFSLDSFLAVKTSRAQQSEAWTRRTKEVKAMELPPKMVKISRRLVGMRRTVQTKKITLQF
eukprot:6174237-Amphidinium_carterae.1